MIELQLSSRQADNYDVVIYFVVLCYQLGQGNA